MRRVRNLVAVCAAAGILLAVSGSAHAAAGVGEPGQAEQATQEQEAPTFARDVLPILQRSCQRCHRPGTGAPMSLLTYQETRPWARAIKDRVVTRQMPPWHVDRGIGEYTADPSLSDAEIATVAGWVDAGGPRGNPADAPPPLDLADLNEWTYGEPDLIVQMEKGFEIPAEGADFYPSEIVDPGLTEDRYVNYPEGTGRKLPAGGLFRFAPHYHPWGEETIDRQKVGIKFYPEGEVPELIVTAHRIRTGIGHDWELNREAVEDRLLRAGYDLDLHADRMPPGALIDDNTLNGVALLSIPPHSVVRHERFFPLPQAALILSFQPHMHFRGKRMLLEANNRHNPDPSAWVGWGGRTMDEMGHGWTDVAFMTDEQYARRVAEREARAANDE